MNPEFNFYNAFPILDYVHKRKIVKRMFQVLVKKCAKNTCQIILSVTWSI